MAGIQTTGLPERLPAHIGIIMDGNGRWAKKHLLPRSAGHREGTKTFQTIAEYCAKIGIPQLTVYAFSTENWSRPKEEVDALMDLFADYLRQLVDRARRGDLAGETAGRIRFLGDRAPLREDIRSLMQSAEQLTARQEGFTLNIAINYGGRDEILHAVRRLAARVKAGQLEPEAITSADLEENLYISGLADVDLIIRPSGEERLSNFLLWQSAYAEFVFLDVLWPDFTPEDLRRALWEYAGRDRRFGGV